MSTRWADIMEEETMEIKIHNMDNWGYLPEVHAEETIATDTMMDFIANQWSIPVESQKIVMNNNHIHIRDTRDIEVHVMGVTGERYIVRCVPSLLVEVMKERIASTMLMGPDYAQHFVLIHHGRVMMNERVLSHYNVEDGSTLGCSVRMTGGSEEQEEDMERRLARYTDAMLDEVERMMVPYLTAVWEEGESARHHNVRMSWIRGNTYGVVFFDWLRDGAAEGETEEQFEEKMEHLRVRFDMDGGVPIAPEYDTDEEREEAPSVHNEALFYDNDTDDTASQNSLPGSEASTLFNHRRARVLADPIADDVGEEDSQATTLEWGGLFEQDLDNTQEDDANEPHHDHGSSDDEHTPAADPNPSPVGFHGGGLGSAAVQVLSVAAAVVEPVGVSTALNSTPLPVGFHGGRFELDEGADSDEPPAQRRRIEAEPVDFQIFVKTLSGATVILWVNRDSSIQSVKERLSDKLGWWMTRPGSLSLVFEGMELQNERSISEHGIQEHNLLHHAPILPTGASEKEDMPDMEPPEEVEGPPEDGGIAHFLTIWHETPDTSRYELTFWGVYI
jgi:hypothetical protein